jgi:hypothetical protein
VATHDEEGQAVMPVYHEVADFVAIGNAVIGALAGPGKDDHIGTWVGPHHEANHPRSRGVSAH